MADEAFLLRMLEPAVRPGGVPGPSQIRREPIESRSFEALLGEATADEAGAEQAQPPESDDVESGPPRANPGVRGGLMDQLAQVDRIQNSALRGIIAGHGTGP